MKSRPVSRSDPGRSAAEPHGDEAADKTAPGAGARAGAILTIDLAAVCANYRRLRAAAQGARCAAVVKADAYGLGAERIARALAAEGCDSFFVAHLDEGLSLRRALGPAGEIFVLNGLPPGTEEECAAGGLVPVLNSPGQLAAWRRVAHRLERKLPAALQIDSGMARLGLSAGEVQAIAADPRALKGIAVTLVMSHLARADEPEARTNPEQRRLFLGLAGALPAAPLSLANSSAIFLGPEYHLDMVRPGAAVYGINPLPGRQNPMRQAVGLKARVIQTRTVSARDGIGYGHAASAPRQMRLATISLGYGDGWHRAAAAAAYYRGHRLPFIGRVSMDSIILDASALPEGALEAGAMVELIGPQQTPEDVAALTGTIGYEVLTSLGRRIHKQYVGE